MQQVTPEALRSFTRKRKLIDPRWQLGVACVVSMFLLGTGALYMLGAQLLHSEKIVDTVGPRAHTVVAVGFDVTFFLGVVALVHNVVVTMTHAVVGPAFVVERGLRSLAEGRHDARFSLREGDYLTPVAQAAEDLQSTLAEQAALLEEEFGHIRTAAGEDPDVAAALGRLEAALLRRGSPVGVEETESAETAAAA